MQSWICKKRGNPQFSSLLIGCPVVSASSYYKYINFVELSGLHVVTFP